MLAKEYKLSCTTNEMQSVKVMGPADAVVFARNFFGDDIDIYESCFIILTNRANKIIGWYKVSSGGLDAVIVDKKIICKVAIDALASGVILVHNHPSGDSKPSTADIKATRDVKDCLKLFDVTLMDHIILASTEYYSFTDEKTIRL
jgi:DNA repair protein RadC